MRRGRLLDRLFELFDSTVRPGAVDEIGLCGDPAPAPRLLRILETETREPAAPYLQIKAIEALGRLREPRAESLLRPLVETKRFWQWRHPRELRITAMQALQKIDPEWARRFLPKVGLSEGELSLAPLDVEPGNIWLRQRRYVRINLPKSLKGKVHTAQGSYPVAVDQLSLGGGVARSQCHVKPGTVVGLEFQSGLRHVRADVLLREARPQELAFELVKIGLDDRLNLRRPLVALQPGSA